MIYDYAAGMPAPQILVSACLVGQACRFDGCAAKPEAQMALTAALAQMGPHQIVSFCPEEAGGLSTPRPPAWIESQDANAVLDRQAGLVTESGEDVTSAFLDGAKKALEVCQEAGIQRALLKEHSPSCGVASTHVAAKRSPGPGVTSALLLRAGIDVTGV